MSDVIRVLSIMLGGGVDGYAAYTFLFDSYYTDLVLLGKKAKSLEETLAAEAETLSPNVQTLVRQLMAIFTEKERGKGKKTPIKKLVKRMAAAQERVRALVRETSEMSRTLRDYLPNSCQDDQAACLAIRWLLEVYMPEDRALDSSVDLPVPVALQAPGVDWERARALLLAIGFRWQKDALVPPSDVMDRFRVLLAIRYLREAHQALVKRRPPARRMRQGRRKARIRVEKTLDTEEKALVTGVVDALQSVAEVVGELEQRDEVEDARDAAIARTVADLRAQVDELVQGRDDLARKLEEANAKLAELAQVADDYRERYEKLAATEAVLRDAAASSPSPLPQAAMPPPPPPPPPAGNRLKIQAARNASDESRGDISAARLRSSQLKKQVDKNLAQVDESARRNVSDPRISVGALQKAAGALRRVEVQAETMATTRPGAQGDFMGDLKAALGRIRRDVATPAGTRSAASPGGWDANPLRLAHPDLEASSVLRLLMFVDAHLPE